MTNVNLLVLIVVLSGIVSFTFTYLALRWVKKNERRKVVQEIAAGLALQEWWDQE